MNNILNEIINSADSSYAEFTAKLIPTIPCGKILGVRAPMAKKIAKKYAKANDGKAFLASLPHAYHDEYMVHAYMLGYLSLPFEEMQMHVSALLPYVDNWAVCDSLCASLKPFFKDRDLALDFCFPALKVTRYTPCALGLFAYLTTILTKNT